MAPANGLGSSGKWVLAFTDAASGCRVTYWLHSALSRHCDCIWTCGDVAQYKDKDWGSLSWSARKPTHPPALFGILVFLNAKSYIFVRVFWVSTCACEYSLGHVWEWAWHVLLEPSGIVLGVGCERGIQIALTPNTERRYSWTRKVFRKSASSLAVILTLKWMHLIWWSLTWEQLPTGTGHSYFQSVTGNFGVNDVAWSGRQL